MSIDLFALAWKVNFPGKPLKKLVLLSLADQANDRDDHCWPTYETIARRCGMSRRTAITTIAQLEREGFIRRVARYKVGGLHTSNAFWINRATMEAAVSSDNGEAASPQPAPMVNVDHHNGAAGSPSLVIDVHPNGDPPAPRTLIEPPTEPKEEPPAAAPPADPAPPAAADPLAPILDWIAFADALKPQERQALDVATLLAWAYTIKLKQAERRADVYNPVGLARSLWRQGNQPRADLLRLARGWLLLDDDGRSRLLGRLEWAIDYGADPGAPLDDEFPDIPLTTAAAVYRAAGGALAPPALSPAEPVCPTDQSPAASQSRANGDRSVPQTNAAWPLWPEVLSELEMQMTRATFTSWFAGTTAAETGDGLIIRLRNESALAWVQSRLHVLVQRAVDDAAGRPLPVRYAVLSDALKEAL